MNLGELRRIVGDRHVLTDAEIVAGHCIDWTGRFRGRSPAVVRPGTTAEVAEVLAWCNRNGVAVVPQGGNTGLVGGSVPRAGEVVLSLRRLGGPDRAAADVAAEGQLTAGAGESIAEIHRVAAAAGWAYGVDFASRDTATVGGSVATNAGGVRVLRYGDTRAQLLGVEAVLADGSCVSHLGGLVKDNTGYHLPSLLCGSEGTLAVVTAARLRLVPALPNRVTALLGLASGAAAVRAAVELRRELPDLESCELMFSAGIALVQERLGLPPVLPEAEAVLLVEAAAIDDPSARLAAAVEALGVPEDRTAVAADAARREALWRYRDGHTEAINTLGAPHKMDVTLPSEALAAFCDDVPAVVTAAVPDRPRVQVWLFGHAADGNVHVNVTGVEPGDERVDDAVLRMVAERGGSIAAEHGIGVAKRPWLHLNRSAAEIETFRRIKEALDPDRILNPGVLL